MMNGVEPIEYHGVFETVRQWPPEARRDLLRDVLTDPGAAWPRSR